MELLRVGLLSCSDRASSGVYADQGLPSLRTWLGRAVRNPLQFEERLVPDERAGIASALRELRGACAFFKILGTYPLDVH